MGTYSRGRSNVMNDSVPNHYLLHDLWVGTLDRAHVAVRRNTPIGKGFSKSTSVPWPAGASTVQISLRQGVDFEKSRLIASYELSDFRDNPARLLLPGYHGPTAGFILDIDEGGKISLRQAEFGGRAECTITALSPHSARLSLAAFQSATFEANTHTDVFISYPRSERVRVEQIKQKLDAMGLVVFFDLEGIDGGDVFPEVIDHALKSAKVVLAFWNLAAFRSKWCMIECRVAVKRRNLVPVALDHFEELDVPAQFMDVQYFDLSDFDGSESHDGWRRTVAQIERLIATGHRESAEL